MKVSEVTPERTEELETARTELAENSSQIQNCKRSLERIEDSSILDYLNLPNCDETSVFEDKVLYESEPMEFSSPPLNHVEFIEKFKLAEFSANSHTAVYLHSDLAKLELKLTTYFQQKLLHQEFEQFSNPDFSKSVMVEGCGTDTQGWERFHLKPCQDFKEKESHAAMYLVGGASTEPFVAYFGRQVLHNPSVLPLNLFSVGRRYRPAAEAGEGRGLTATQQSTAVQLFSVSATEQQMREQHGQENLN